MEQTLFISLPVIVALDWVGEQSKSASRGRTRLFINILQIAVVVYVDRCIEQNKKACDDRDFLCKWGHISESQSWGDSSSSLLSYA